MRKWLEKVMPLEGWSLLLLLPLVAGGSLFRQASHITPFDSETWDDAESCESL